MIENQDSTRSILDDEKLNYFILGEKKIEEINLGLDFLDWIIDININAANVSYEKFLTAA